MPTVFQLTVVDMPRKLLIQCCNVSWEFYCIKSFFYIIVVVVYCFDHAFVYNSLLELYTNFVFLILPETFITVVVINQY